MTLKRTPRPTWRETVELRPGAAEDLPKWAQEGRPDLAMPSDDLGDLSAIQAEAERQRILDQAAGVAQGAARDAVREMQDEDRQKRDAERASLAPFLGYLQTLRMSAEDGAEAPRTELKMTLQRIEGTGGPKPRRIFCTEETLDNAGAVAMGAPCLEQRTQDYAERAGKFGRYEWRIRGWVAGSLTLDTSAVVHVEPPPGYVQPVAPQVEARPTQEDQLGGLDGALGLVSKVSALLGHQAGGASQGISYEAADRMKAAAYEQGQKAGKIEGRWEADRDHRKEMDDHRDRARTREEDAERRGLDRGRLEGAREVRAELDPKIWKLEHETSPEGGPSIVQEIVGAMGGPDAMQALVGGIVQAMNAPPKPTGTGAAARPAAAPRNIQQLKTAPSVRPNPTPTPAPLAHPEPTRAEHYEAMGQLETALSIVEEAIDQAEPGQIEQAERFHAMALAFHGLGLGDGPMGGWWAAWRQSWLTQVETLISAHEDREALEEEPEAPTPPTPPTEEGTAPMTLEAMKTLLLDRLEEGAEDAAILAELDHLTTPEQRAEWRASIGSYPVAMVAGAIGGGRHTGRLTGLLGAFKAGA